MFFVTNRRLKQVMASFLETIEQRIAQINVVGSAQVTAEVHAAVQAEISSYAEQIVALQNTNASLQNALAQNAQGDDDAKATINALATRTADLETALLDVVNKLSKEDVAGAQAAASAALPQPVETGNAGAAVTTDTGAAAPTAPEPEAPAAA